MKWELDLVLSESISLGFRPSERSLHRDLESEDEATAADTHPGGMEPTLFCLFILQKQGTILQTIP